MCEWPPKADEWRGASLPHVPHVGEYRVTDATTGGSKGQKATQMSTIDPIALDAVGRVGGMGAEKYDRYNYLRGFAWHLSYDALQRHLQAFWGGENDDPESGLSHLAHASWHCLALISFVMRGLGTDDRPPVKHHPGQTHAE